MRRWTWIALTFALLSACRKESGRDVSANGLSVHVGGTVTVGAGTYFTTVKNTSPSPIAISDSCLVQFIAPGETVVCESFAGLDDPKLSAPAGDYVPMVVKEVSVLPARDAQHVRVHAVVRNTHADARFVDLHATLRSTMKPSAIAGGKDEFSTMIRLLDPGEEAVAEVEVPVLRADGLDASVVAYGRKAAMREPPSAKLSDYHSSGGSPTYIGTITNVSQKPLFPAAALAFHDKNGRIVGAAWCSSWGELNRIPIEPSASATCSTSQIENVPAGWETMTIEVRGISPADQIVNPREQLQMP